MPVAVVTPRIWVPAGIPSKDTHNNKDYGSFKQELFKICPELEWLRSAAIYGAEAVPQALPMVTSVPIQLTAGNKGNVLGFRRQVRVRKHDPIEVYILAAASGQAMSGMSSATTARR
jgi:hypothetical protein